MDLDNIINDVENIRSDLEVVRESVPTPEGREWITRMIFGLAAIRDKLAPLQAPIASSDLKAKALDLARKAESAHRIGGDALLFAQLAQVYATLALVQRPDQRPRLP